MKIKIAVIILLVATVVIAMANSHPNYKNNGINSPRFYGKVHTHPEHP